MPGGARPNRGDASYPPRSSSGRTPGGQGNMMAELFKGATSSNCWRRCRGKKVMPGLVPGIHVFTGFVDNEDMDGRDTWREDVLRALPGHHDKKKVMDEFVRKPRHSGHAVA